MQPVPNCAYSRNKNRVLHAPGFDYLKMYLVSVW